MQVELGDAKGTRGTIAATAGGELVYTGDRVWLRRLVRSVAGGTDPRMWPGGAGWFLMEMLRTANNGYLWCNVVGERTADGATTPADVTDVTE